MKYPPGPWRIDGLRIRSGKRTICEVYVSNEGDTKNIADLIAAAPEMIDALREIDSRIEKIRRKAHRYDDEVNEHLDNIAVAVHDAMERAKGLAP